MPKNKKLVKTLEYHFHRDSYNNDFVSDNSNGEGFNGGCVGVPITELIEELIEQRKLKRCRDYKLRVSIEIEDKGRIADY